MRWVRNEDYNRVKNKLENSDRTRNAADSKVSEARRKLRNAEENLAREKERLGNDIESIMHRESQRLQGGLDEISEELRLELGRQKIRFREQLVAVYREMENVNATADQLEQRISEVSNQFNTEFGRIVDRIENQKDRAILWRNQLAMVLEEVASLHPDKLTPGEAELLMDGLTFVETDMKDGNYEAAIGVAQTNIPTALQLRTRLEEMNVEFSQLVEQIEVETKEIMRRIDELKDNDRNRCSISQPDASVNFDGRIAYWSNGIFDSIEERFREVRDSVEREYKVTMDIDALRHALGSIKLTNGYLDECIRLAHDEFYETYRVSRLARRINDILTEEDTWTYVDSGFADNDSRRPYSMVFRYGDGTIASFVITPVREVKRKNRNGTIEYGETQFSVDVCGNEPVKNEFYCGRLRMSILERLHKAGVDIGNLNDRGVSSCSSEDFIQRGIAAGDKIKDGRITAIKTNMQMKR